MRQRILCPFHNEATPSLVLYPENDRYVCFGCGKGGPISELNLNTELTPIPRLDYTVTKEQIEKKVAEIEAMPVKEIRGLPLNYDYKGFYIVWPDKSYYLARYTNSFSHSAKYKGPAGVTRPLLILEGESNQVVFVEGEMNALSIYKACPELTVVTPGGAGSFSSKGVSDYLTKLLPYEKILIVVDGDSAGVSALIAAKSKLLGLGHKKVMSWVCEKNLDANDILQKHGEIGLRQKVYEEFEV